MCIKLTRNNMIVLMVTQILKEIGSSKNRSAGWIENRKTEYKCFKRALKSIHLFLVPNSLSRMLEITCWRTWNRLTLNLASSGRLCEGGDNRSLLTRRWEQPSNSLFSGPRILATMLNPGPIPICNWGISLWWKWLVSKEKISSQERTESLLIALPT